MKPGPAPGAFPEYPSSWYLFGEERELCEGPVSRDLLGRRLVAFRAGEGQVAVLEGRCAHMGTDLGLGTVRNGVLQCAFHGWEYGPDGRCVRIPAGCAVPGFARVAAYPTQVRHGLVFFFNGVEPLFPLPFFEGLDPDDFVPAPPIEGVLECPWYLVGANAFDIQHFRGAHDRPLLDEPRVEVLPPYARRIILPLAVGGDSLRDAVTRLVAGPEVTMSFTDWAGTLVFSTAHFARTTSRGLVLIQPMGPNRVKVQVVVFVPRSRSWLGRTLLDTVHRHGRRWFISRFLSADAVLGGRGLRYNPHSLTQGDSEMVEYFHWLADFPRCPAPSVAIPATTPPAPPATEPRSELHSVVAPRADEFPEVPASWYLFGESRELANGPVEKKLLGRTLVAFRTTSGQAALLDGRCAHMGASLVRGRVVGGTIQCPFHGWRYGADGRCVEIPGCPAIPATARQTSYPVREQNGLVFFFNGPEPLFELPFFDGHDPAEFVRARPYGIRLECPWYMVGANAFDVQHFSGAHDRKLAGPATVDYPHPHACRASAPFSVLGDSLRDRVTRLFAGDEVRLSITDWCGTVMFVTATFARTRSYGLLIARPESPTESYVEGVVFVKRSRNALARLLFDPFHAHVRRYFVKEFLRSDAVLAARGFRYEPRALLECDADLARYFRWLADSTSAATPS